MSWGCCRQPACRDLKAATSIFTASEVFTNLASRTSGSQEYEEVSENSGFSPQIIHLNRVFRYKPSILGYHYFWKHPYDNSAIVVLKDTQEHTPDDPRFPRSVISSKTDEPLDSTGSTWPYMTPCNGKVIFLTTIFSTPCRISSLEGQWTKILAELTCWCFTNLNSLVISRCISYWKNLEKMTW